MPSGMLGNVKLPVSFVTVSYETFVRVSVADDRDARHRGAGLVGDGAENRAACGLREGRGRQARDHQHCQHRHDESA